MNKNSLWLILSSLAWKTSLFSVVVFPQTGTDFNEDNYQNEAAVTSEEHQDDPIFLRQDEENVFYLSYEEDRVKKNSPSKEESAKELISRLQIGVNYTRVYLNPHGHSSFDGNLGGLQGIYEYRPMNHFYGGAKLAWKEGNTDGSAGKRSLIYIDVQERLGYTFAFDHNDWLMTLFTGFGYRYLGQKFSSKDDASLKFRYNEFYVPVGLLTDYAVNSWFSFGMGLTWMPQVYPTVSIVPLKGARWTLTNTLVNFFVEFPLLFTLTDDKRFLLILNPFYEHWEDGHTTAKSASGISLGLPGNDYNFFGADLNFVYRF